MDAALITGSAGLVGSQTARFLAAKGYLILGVDNDMRRLFFGEEASTAKIREDLQRTCPNYRHFDLDIRDAAGIEKLFKTYSSDIKAVIHAAAQPSHDWAAREPLTDFAINANATLNLLENTRRYAPQASFIFTSTNKVYGDRPNRINLVELDTRYECLPGEPWHDGFDESLSLDASTHSVFGASKAAADLMVQEYGRYFKLNSVCFRCGCLTGPEHNGAQLHGFLAYLVKCALSKTPYTVFGYKAKQVRDNIHVKDLVEAFWAYLQNPKPGAVYNIGGGRHSNCSMLEAIAWCEKFCGEKMAWTYDPRNRIGDHIWYVSDQRKFKADYPGWSQQYALESTLLELAESLARRL